MGVTVKPPTIISLNICYTSHDEPHRGDCATMRYEPQCGTCAALWCGGRAYTLLRLWLLVKGQRLQVFSNQALTKVGLA